MLQCEQDFGGWIVSAKDHDGAPSQIQNGNFRLLAMGTIVIYCSRVVLQTLAFWVRRASAPEESSDHVPLHTMIYSGIFHGVFILLAQYPLDLPNLLTARWSILQPRARMSSKCCGTIRHISDLHLRHCP